MKLTKSELRNIIKEEIQRLNEEKEQFSVVLFGGSIGEKPIRNLRDLKDKKVLDNRIIYDNIDDAKEKAKRMNKYLSPGEKKYYGLRYKVVRVKNGKYTGK